MMMNPRTKAKLCSALRWLLPIFAWFATSPIFPQTTFAYDQIQVQQLQGSLAYDGDSRTAFSYDSAAVRVADENEIQTAATVGFFADFPGFLAAKTALNGHHPLPKFLGGDASQLLSKIDPKIHTEFHQILRQDLKDAGMPLRVGGKGGSAADWAQYMQFNPGAQRTAFDSVLNASRAIDTKYGTQITQDVWKNVMPGNFTPYP